MVSVQEFKKCSNSFLAGLVVLPLHMVCLALRSPAIVVLKGESEFR